jgi:hypothetical protein
MFKPGDRVRFGPETGTVTEHSERDRVVRVRLDSGRQITSDERLVLPAEPEAKAVAGPKATKALRGPRATK